MSSKTTASASNMIERCKQVASKVGVGEKAIENMQLCLNILEQIQSMCAEDDGCCIVDDSGDYLEKRRSRVIIYFGFDQRFLHFHKSGMARGGMETSI